MMDTPKRRIVLTDDNWHDYLPMDYVEKLVAESPTPRDGYDSDDKLVTRLLAWVGMQSGQSKEYRFEMTPYDASVVLNLAAGWDPNQPT
ncbi:MAG TPA: hypothetical protein VH120_05265 [Gemmataceae bacterium]|nr:hypothetical protein [Gemmataceae bacterium]